MALDNWASKNAVFLRHELANALVGLRWVSESDVAGLDLEEVLPLIARRVDTVLCAMRLLGDPGAEVICDAGKFVPASALGGLIVSMPQRLVDLIWALGPFSLEKQEECVVVGLSTTSPEEWKLMLEELDHKVEWFVYNGCLTVTIPLLKG